MEIIRIAVQIIVALGIYNVWLVRYHRATPYRAGDATNMREEFANYGLPYSFMLFVGSLKILLATLLVIGVYYASIVQPAALGLAILMMGAVAMHVKVGDPVVKAIPASTVLLLCGFIVVAKFS